MQAHSTDDREVVLAANNLCGWVFPVGNYVATIDTTYYSKRFDVTMVSQAYDCKHGEACVAKLHSCGFAGLSLSTRDRLVYVDGKFTNFVL